MIDDSKEYRIKKLDLIKSSIGWTLLAGVVTIFGVTKCNPRSSYELKEIAGDGFLVNKDTGEIAHVLGQQVVLLPTKTPTFEEAKLKLDEVPFSYNSKDSFRVLLRAKWGNALFHYRIFFLPDAASFGPKSQAFLKAIADGNSQAKIVLKDKDGFEVFSIPLPKLKYTDHVTSSFLNKASGLEVNKTTNTFASLGIKAIYQSESSMPISAELYNEIHGWEIDWGK